MEEDAPRAILTFNAGSSSLRFAAFACEKPVRRLLAGRIERVGLEKPALRFTDAANKTESRAVQAANHRAAAELTGDLLEKQIGALKVAAIGHRIVHGGRHYTAPQRLAAKDLDQLRNFIPLAPAHLPGEIEVIETARQRFPGVPQIGCFDTAFHRDLPRVARVLPIPRRYEAKGVERYGFHGLSYEFLLDELLRLGEPAARAGRMILAHLGNGASMAAVRDGKCIDTSMAFTPAAGLVMGRRSGDLDPGLSWYLARTEQMTPEQFDAMVNSESGLLGISEISSEVPELLNREKEDARAGEAIALFCYQAKKWIGSFAAALGGLDMLVFTAGIGENSAVIRERICEGLGFLGIELDGEQNGMNAVVISTKRSKVKVRVMRTDEELMMARSVSRLLEEKQL
jgi:acetate kinase